MAWIWFVRSSLNYGLESLLRVIQTWFSQIQEQPWNSNSACWKTLHTLIFNWKFQLLEYWRPLEALEKFYEITAPVWMDFKNSFAWLTGIKKQIFYQNKFLWFRPFFDPSDLKKRSKNSSSQKICYDKKSVFPRPSTTQRNFWNPFTPVLWFYYLFFQSFWWPPVFQELKFSVKNQLV